MRKIKSFLLLLLTLVLFTQAAAAWAAVPVYLDGKPLQNVLAADIKENTLFGPIRPLAEKLGADVVYDGRQVSVTLSGTAVTLTPGSRDAAVRQADGSATTYRLAAAPYLEDGSLMLPLRFVAEQLGCLVTYHGTFTKIILPGDFIGGRRAYTMAMGDNLTGRKHIVNSCIAMIADCRRQAIDKPDGIMPQKGWADYAFYDRQSELIEHWLFWVPEGADKRPYGALYLQNVLTGQFYLADEAVFDYYFADNGEYLELEIAAFMGPKGVEFD